MHRTIQSSTPSLMPRVISLLLGLLALTLWLSACASPQALTAPTTSSPRASSASTTTTTPTPAPSVTPTPAPAPQVVLPNCHPPAQAAVQWTHLGPFDVIATVTNDSDCANDYVLGVFRIVDGQVGHQATIGQAGGTAQPGQTLRLSVAVKESCGEKYQADVFFGATTLTQGPLTPLAYWHGVFTAPVCPPPPPPPTAPKVTPKPDTCKLTLTLDRVDYTNEGIFGYATASVSWTSNATIGTLLWGDGQRMNTSNGGTYPHTYGPVFTTTDFTAYLQVPGNGPQCDAPQTITVDP